MRILVTNDDGYDHPGILALKGALAPLGEVILFAPDGNRSGVSLARTFRDPIRVDEAILPDDTLGFVCSGTPADCVALAFLGVVDPPPDLVVSGVNQGANLGDEVLYSGTVSAAMEAVLNGVPGIAVSLDAWEGGDFRVPARFAAHLVARLLERGLPRNLLLNVNVPNLPPEGIRGVQVTRLGKRIYRDALEKHVDMEGRVHYRLVGQPPRLVLKEGTDVRAVADGYISLTPLRLDMTEEALLQEVSSWGIDLPW